MNIDTRVQFGILIVTALSLGWTAGYYSRGDRIETLETKLQSYKDMGNLNIAETTKKLVSANEVIANNISEINSYYSWKSEEKTLTSKISSLSEDLNKQSELLKIEVNSSSKLKVDLASKQKQLDSLSPINEEFWMDENTTKGIAGFEGVLGLLDVRSNSVVVIYENKKHTLYAGNYIEVSVRGSSCKIIASQIKYNGSPEKGLFTTVCKKI